MPFNNPFDMSGLSGDELSVMAEKFALMQEQDTNKKEPFKWMAILLEHYAAPALLKGHDVNTVSANIKDLIEHLSS